MAGWLRAWCSGARTIAAFRLPETPGAAAAKLFSNSPATRELKNNPNKGRTDKPLIGGPKARGWPPSIPATWASRKTRRFYTKFAPDHGCEHHFVALGGYNPPSRWPAPKAGARPHGDERMHVFVDPVGWYGKYPPPGVWNLYAYWPEMKRSAVRGSEAEDLEQAQTQLPLDRRVGRWHEAPRATTPPATPEKGVCEGGGG